MQRYSSGQGFACSIVGEDTRPGGSGQETTTPVPTTQASTQASTESATEPATEAPTEAPATTAPTEGTTAAPVNSGMDLLDALWFAFIEYVFEP